GDPGVGLDSFFHAIYTRRERLAILLGTANSEVTETLARVVPYWNILQAVNDLVTELETANITCKATITFAETEITEQLKALKVGENLLYASLLMKRERESNLPWYNSDATALPA
ncbi:unnamed protein product, partial [Nesidiocoris tenuis]